MSSPRFSMKALDIKLKSLTSLSGEKVVLGFVLDLNDLLHLTNRSHLYDRTGGLMRYHVEWYARVLFNDKGFVWQGNVGFSV